MTKAYRSVRSFSEIADFVAEESAQVTEPFAHSFTETVDGYRISVADEVITNDMPDAMQVQLATEMLVRTMFDVLRDSRLEDLSDRLAWGIVHAFHRVAGQLDGEADKAAMKVKGLIREADGSEVMMNELEEAQTLCQSLDEARDAVACMRDHAAATFHAETGRPWSTPRGSLVSSKRTASVIAAQDYLAARRQRRIDAHHPQAPVVIFSGGAEGWNDHALIWDRLDSVHARIPAMVLATSAQDKGCDAMAAAWAASRGVRLIAFTLNRKLGKQAGFRRNEQLLALRPVEAVVAQGSGLQSHLAREVRAKGIPAHFICLAQQRKAA
ncbi:DUF2493 domain-containing protein [Novosphingobium album (ex Liu et al. 2023)]|uniref:DUF2493 domain-containing protein n=1 Tax=Novosphingobium album (ex Liu et al. 2023) TaxID=3031130 RepID=A0ABT5WSB2_9SPHN|nr:DUF2493 domain-containing protein [Novosphingobium album (ex Liu et al. 2023)]MDE8652137.1 DUF2493 domain-containing protein [Novosphingobium album (ex Liu et al. 2023)]